VAGARAGVGIAPPEVYDPERIRAALRGGHERSDQVGRRTSGAGWDTPADQTIKTANGNHAADSWSAEPSDAAAWPDPAKSAEHTDQFQWLPDNGSAAAFGVAPAEPTAGEWAPGLRDHVLKPPERTDFWTTQNTAASADLQPPATASHWVDERDLTQSTWSTPTEPMAVSSDSSAAAAVSQRSRQAATDPAPSAGSATTTPPGASASSAGSAGVTGSTRSAAGKSTGTERTDHQRERLFTAVRLLVIIVIAALIGSALVLLLT